MEKIQKFFFRVFLLYCGLWQTISAADYSYSFLTALPSYMPADATEIDLSHNEIPDIPHWAFYHNSDLISLDLSFNLLTFIRLRAFDGITCLKLLNLANNNIAVIPAGVFDDGMPCLTELDLSLNVIVTIREGAFLQNNLENLILNSNRLTSIHSADFAGIPNILSLNFGDNMIDKIYNDTFMGLLNLTTLVLRRNVIDEIELDAFVDLQNLTLMDIGMNKLEYLYTPIFANLSELRDLNLCENRILDIHNDTFNPLRSLMNLNLSFNHLGGFPNLEPISDTLCILSIDGNDIEDIPENYFLNFSNLTRLTMSNTSLTSLKGDQLYGLSSLAYFNCINCPIGHDFNVSVFRSNTNLTVLRLGGTNLHEFPCVSLYSEPPPYSLQVNVHHNNIKTISEECIDSMHNFTDIRIILSSNGLTELTMFEPILDRITYLDVKRNRLETYFPPGSYSWTMTTLNLDENRFATCPDFHQELRQQLKNLYLTANDMSCLDFHHMNTFLVLQELRLNTNNLTAFPDYGCDGYTGPEDPLSLPNLKTLIIHNNQLYVAPDLTEMAKLRYVYINNNKLQTLEPVKLNGLGQLETLEASNNHISDFPDFREMGTNAKIRNLFLSNNYILHVPWNRIQPLKKLEILKLVANEITAFIPDYSLQVGVDPVQNDAMLTSIRQLGIDNNRLSKISDTVLRRMTSLQWLNISNNLLPSFQNMSYHYMITPPIKVNLAGNPLRCKDEMCWVKDSVPMGNVTLIMDTKPCVGSPSLANRLWASITKKDLECYKIIGRMWKDSRGNTMYGTVTAEVETVVLLEPAHRLRDMATASSEDCALYCDKTEFCDYIYFDPEVPLPCALIRK